jgi:hypothetical protein
MSSRNPRPEIQRIPPYHRECEGGQALAVVLVLALLAGLATWAMAKPRALGDPLIACAKGGVVTSAQVDAAVLRARRVAEATVGPKLSGALYTAARLGSSAGGGLRREAAAEELKGMESDLATLCARSGSQTA